MNEKKEKNEKKIEKKGIEREEIGKFLPLYAVIQLLLECCITKILGVHSMGFSQDPRHLMELDQFYFLMKIMILIF